MACPFLTGWLWRPAGVRGKWPDVPVRRGELGRGLCPQEQTRSLHTSRQLQQVDRSKDRPLHVHTWPNVSHKMNLFLAAIAKSTSGHVGGSSCATLVRVSSYILKKELLQLRVFYLNCTFRYCIFPYLLSKYLFYGLCGNVSSFILRVYLCHFIAILSCIRLVLLLLFCAY